MEDFSEGEEIVLEQGDDSEDEEEIAVIEVADVEEDEAENDEGQTVHNEKVANTLREKPIQQTAANGIIIDSREEKVALQIFPKVSFIFTSYAVFNFMQVAGLACRVHDNAVLKEKFERLVLADEELHGQRKLGGIMILNAWMLISISATLLSNLQLYHRMDYKHIV